MPTLTQMETFGRRVNTMVNQYMGKVDTPPSELIVELALHEEQLSASDLRCGLATLAGLSP